MIKNNENFNLSKFENEEWLPVVGYEGLYEISNLGKVKSLRDNNGKPREKILRQGKMKNGYLYVVLCKEGKVKTFLIHRLVAQAFIQNPNNYQTVNHIDENKENNCIDNLEWMDMKQQVNHGTCIQRRVAHTDYKAFQEKRVANTDYKAIAAKIDYKEIGRKNAEKQSKRVYQYSLDSTLVAIWQSTRECGRQGYNQGNVAACCRGELKSHKGYIWSYTPINSK